VNQKVTNINVRIPEHTIIIWQ